MLISVLQTSLLNAILGEMATNSGVIDINGSVSYAPQEPWVFSGSVMQNILFGQPFDETRYKRVLEVCALDYDIKIWEQHDNTLVGEKGVILSGWKSFLLIFVSIYIIGFFI